ncbi:cyclic pyranopterin monophosphate synthase MoaC [Halorussus lipolyticus]|uniref:cyclic pyranopterin monophosphate synthase MoaC n=1 Tax=Halorussus lipolyticus TaxID=3034024 RepID=UPI0023E7E5D3|nr:cyclic pyranopterin monophosphate synthase MoaC [Halorussus sp. DT80]
MSDESDSPEAHRDGGGETADETDLTHTDDEGEVQMVDVGDKPDTARRAVAEGEIHLQSSTIDAIENNEVSKGDVLATARVGAVQAVKHTWETIPMCHQIPITNVETDFDLRDDCVVLEVAVETTGKTGCEMEALEGVTTGLNVVWDMVKAAEKSADSSANRSGEAAEDAGGQYPDTAIRNVRVVEKRKTEL